MAAHIFGSCVNSMAKIVTNSVGSHFKRGPVHRHQGVNSKCNRVTCLNSTCRVSVSHLSRLRSLVSGFGTTGPTSRGTTVRRVMGFLTSSCHRVALTTRGHVSVVINTLLVLNRTAICGGSTTVASNRAGGGLLRVALPFGFVGPGDKSIIISKGGVFVSCLERGLRSLTPSCNICTGVIVAHTSFGGLVLNSSRFNRRCGVVLNDGRVGLDAKLISSSLTSRIFANVNLPHVRVGRSCIGSRAKGGIRVCTSGHVALLPSSGVNCVHRRAPCRTASPMRKHACAPSRKRVLVSGCHSGGNHCVRCATR